MHPYIVRALRSAAVLAVISVAACGDKEVGSSRLDAIKVGDDRAAVMKVLGDGPLTAVGSDTARLEHGFRHMQYLIDGHQFEVIYYREAIGTVTEAVEQQVETPVVLEDNKVLGTGWKFYVEAIKKYRLPTPLAPKVEPPKRDTSSSIGRDTTKAAPVVKKPIVTPDSIRTKM